MDMSLFSLLFCKLMLHKVYLYADNLIHVSYLIFSGYIVLPLSADFVLKCEVWSSTRTLSNCILTVFNCCICDML